MNIYHLFDFYVANNNLKAVEMHLKMGVSPNRYIFGSYLPLAVATFLEFDEMFGLLVKYGADESLLASSLEKIKQTFS